MLNTLAHIPWVFVAAVAFAGVILFLTGNRRVEPRIRFVGLILFSVAVLMGVARCLIDTDAERMERRTRQIVADADKKDWKALAAMLDDKTSLDMSGKGAIPVTKGGVQIATAAQKGAELIGLQNVSIHSVRVTEIGETPALPALITVTFTAASTQELTQDRPFITGWEFDWEHRGAGWYLRLIKLTQMGNEAL